MIKKLVVAGLFLGGGIYAIRKLLPKFQRQEYKADIQDYEVKRFYSNPTGGGGIGKSYDENYTRNSLPFNVFREKADQEFWGGNTYDEEGIRQKSFKKYIL